MDLKGLFKVTLPVDYLIEGVMHLRQYKNNIKGKVAHNLLLTHILFHISFPEKRPT